MFRTAAIAAGTALEAPTSPGGSSVLSCSSVGSAPKQQQQGTGAGDGDGGDDDATGQNNGAAGDAHDLQPTEAAVSK